MTIRLCAADDVPENEIIAVTLDDGRTLAVYRMAGVFYASDDLCTHGEASLADGYIEEGQIVCSYHMGKFCIKTGEPTGAPCSVPLQVYKVAEENGNIVLVE